MGRPAAAAAVHVQYLAVDAITDMALLLLQCRQTQSPKAMGHTCKASAYDIYCPSASQGTNLVPNLMLRIDAMPACQPDLAAAGFQTFLECPCKVVRLSRMAFTSRHDHIMITLEHEGTF